MPVVSKLWLLTILLPPAALISRHLPLLTNSGCPTPTLSPLSTLRRMRPKFQSVLVLPGCSILPSNWLTSSTVNANSSCPIPSSNCLAVSLIRDKSWAACDSRNQVVFIGQIIHQMCHKMDDSKAFGKLKVVHHQKCLAGVFTQACYVELFQISHKFFG